MEGSRMSKIKFMAYSRAVAVAAALPTIALVVGAGRKF
jgi:hypothetical protein